MKTNKIAEWVSAFVKRHPAARPGDIYKLLYQKNFGPAHILSDPAISKERFFEEFELAEPIEGEIFYAVDPEKTVFWIKLPAAKWRGIAPERIWKAVVNTGTEFIGKKDSFLEDWIAAAMLLREMGYPGAEIAKLDADARRNNPPATHHSNEFRESECPNYRIACRKAILEIGGGLTEAFRAQFPELSAESESETEKMPDVQNDAPEHPLDIDRVGIMDLAYPIVVLDRNRRVQSTVADVTISVDLPAQWRGTHMSRFLEILNKFRGEITYVQIRAILEAMLGEFGARAAHIRLVFPYFIEKKAPVTGAASLMEYTAIFDGELDRDGYRFRVGIEAPVTTLCPCSKELCEKSAHSQRAFVEIEVLSPAFIWIEDLIELAERAASSPVYSLLKRPDEKAVTETAYDNPRFVEDVAREIAKELDGYTDIAEFFVRVVSMESIHNHSAFATITGGKGQGAFDNYFSPLAGDADDLIAI